LSFHINVIEEDIIYGDINPKVDRMHTSNINVKGIGDRGKFSWGKEQRS
jgi:hypothetical protein